MARLQRFGHSRDQKRSSCVFRSECFLARLSSCLAFCVKIRECNPHPPRTGKQRVVSALLTGRNSGTFNRDTLPSSVDGQVEPRLVLLTFVESQARLLLDLCFLRLWLAVSSYSWQAPGAGKLWNLRYQVARTVDMGSRWRSKSTRSFYVIGREAAP